MPKTREQKAAILDRLTSAFRAAKSAAFADYRGMNVSDITDLRKKMHEQDVEYVVAKKTLLTRSAKDAGYDIDFTDLDGMIGVAIAHGDEMAPVKIIGDAGKEGAIKLIGGIFEGKIVDETYANELSKLPSKHELLTQLLYMLNGPAGAFVRLLNAYREKREEGAPVEAPTEAKEEKEEKTENAAPATEQETATDEATKDNSSEESAAS